MHTNNGIKISKKSYAYKKKKKNITMYNREDTPQGEKPHWISKTLFLKY